MRISKRKAHQGVCRRYEPREGKKPPKLKAKVVMQLERGKAFYKPSTAGRQRKSAASPETGNSPELHHEKENLNKEQLS